MIKPTSEIPTTTQTVAPKETNETRAVRKEEARFRQEVLKFVKDSQLGSRKAGLGPLSVRSRQSGNEDLAKNMFEIQSDIAAMSNSDGFGFGKKIYTELKKLNQEALTATVEEQLIMKEQIKSLKIMQSMLAEDTIENAQAKKRLGELIAVTEGGFKSNTRTFDRFADFSQKFLPSIAGILSGAFAGSPLVAMAVNYVGEKIQEKRERKNEAKKRTAETLFDYSDDVIAHRVETEKMVAEAAEEFGIKIGEAEDSLEDFIEAASKAAEDASADMVQRVDDRLKGSRVDKDDMIASDDLDLFQVMEDMGEERSRIERDFIDNFETGLTEAIGKALDSAFPEGVGEEAQERLDSAFSSLNEELMKLRGLDDSKVEKVTDSALGQEVREINEAVWLMKSDVSEMKSMLAKLTGEERLREEELHRKKLLDAMEGEGGPGGEKSGESRGLLGTILAAMGIKGGISGLLGALKAGVVGLGAGLMAGLRRIGPMAVRWMLKAGMVAAVGSGLLEGVRQGWSTWVAGGSFGAALADGLEGMGRQIASFLSFGLVDTRKIANWISEKGIMDPIFAAFDWVVENNPISLMWRGLVAASDWANTTGRAHGTAVANTVRNIQDKTTEFFASIIPSWIPDSVLPDAVVRIRRDKGISVGEDVLAGEQSLDFDSNQIVWIQGDGAKTQSQRRFGGTGGGFQTSGDRSRFAGTGGGFGTTARDVNLVSRIQRLPGGSGRGHQLTEAQIAYLAETDELLGLPPGFSMAQIQVESAFNPSAVSHAGAMGLAQTMPSTTKTWSERQGRELDPFNPEDSLLMHRLTMQENMNRFGNAADAARAYNGGWTPSRWGNPETSAYVPKIESAMNSQVVVDGESSGVDKEARTLGMQEQQRRNTAAEAQNRQAGTNVNAPTVNNNVNQNSTTVQRRSPRNEDVTIDTTHRPVLA